MNPQKKNSHIGDKILLCVNPMYIHIPTWQRDLNLSRSLQIGQSYQAAKWNVPKVFYNKKKGILMVADGQHRIYGAFCGKIESVVVEVLETSEENAIKLFMDQTVDTMKMKPFNIYKAGLYAGIDEYVELKKICDNNNVGIKGTDYSAENVVGIISSISDARALKNKGILDKALKLIGNLQWNGSGDINASGKAYCSRVLRVIKNLYAYYGDEIEDILTRRCKGAEYFNKNLSCLYQDQLFDRLSDIIGTELNMETVSTYNGKNIRRVRRVS